MSDYQDATVTCTDRAVELRGYYFPWGTKRIPYSSIRAVQRVEMGALRGRARIWGTANPGLWANYDPSRPKKKVALILDVGKRVSPFITPDDPDAVESTIRMRAQLGPGGDATRGPFI
ncbi:MAG: hypothetical protein ABSC34_12145 [Acidimicrobiales bacterium]|jgi:hypothetical protein